MPTGRVKWFSLEKGFGFISNDEGEDVYLSADALPSGVTTVKPGTKLEFSIADGRRGPQALSVSIVEAPPSRAPITQIQSTLLSAFITTANTKAIIQSTMPIAMIKIDSFILTLFLTSR